MGGRAGVRSGSCSVCLGERASSIAIAAAVAVAACWTPRSDTAHTRIPTARWLLGRGCSCASWSGSGSAAALDVVLLLLLLLLI